MLDRFREAEGDILVVDDEADTAPPHAPRAGGEWLERVGSGERHARRWHHVATAATQASSCWTSNMPVMDGFEFLERSCAQRPGCGTVPVVVLTVQAL